MEALIKILQTVNGAEWNVSSDGKDVYYRAPLEAFDATIAAIDAAFLVDHYPSSYVYYRDGAAFGSGRVNLSR